MNDMKICVYLLLAFSLQMIRKCEGGTESEPTLECLEESDPMGERYRGTISQTKNGVECQRWDTDERHTRHDKPKDLDNNYCRNPNPDENTSRLPWCYTTSNTWEYCFIKTCGSCNGVIYDNKCFIVVFDKSLSERIDQDGAVAECQRHGGYLANLYSNAHMDAVMSYIRELEFRGYRAFRTGLNFNPLANKLTLRDGTDAPGELQWGSDEPYTEASFADFTNVLLQVDSNPSDIHQYLFNNDPAFKAYVLCEIE